MKLQSTDWTPEPHSYLIQVEVEQDLANPASPPGLRYVIHNTWFDSSFVYAEPTSRLLPTRRPAVGSSLEISGYQREGGQCVADTLQALMLEPGREGFIRPAGACPPPDEDVHAVYGKASRSLGCAASPGIPRVRTPDWAEPLERFQHGRMLYLRNSIYVLEDGPGEAGANGGTWSGVRDAWRDFEPEQASLTPPTEGLLEPRRGFGKAWRNHYGGPDGPLGWAVEAEHAELAVWQLFDGGIVIATSAGPGFILYHDGQAWERKDR